MYSVADICLHPVFGSCLLFLDPYSRSTLLIFLIFSIFLLTESLSWNIEAFTSYSHLKTHTFRKQIYLFPFTTSLLSLFHI